jgi:hypothetical protein
LLIDVRPRPRRHFARRLRGARRLLRSARRRYAAGGGGDRRLFELAELDLALELAA